MNSGKQAASLDEAQVLQDNIEQLARHLERLLAGPASDANEPDSTHAAIRVKAILDHAKQLSDARTNQIICWKCSAT